MRTVRIAFGWLAAGFVGLAYQAPAPPVGPPLPPQPSTRQAPLQTPQTPVVPGKGTIEGQVVSLSTGQPLKRASVRLVGIGRRPEGGMPNMLTKETDDQGRFAFIALSAGRYQLTAERQGYLRQNYGARKYSNGGMPLVLGQDQNVKDVVFKLSPQSVITGKVLDEDGEPVAGVQVRAWKYAYRGGKKQWTQSSNGQTSDIGEYRIANLDPGRYIVSANPGNRGPNMMQTASSEPLPSAPEMIFAATYYPSTADSTTAVTVDVASGSETRGIDIRLRRTRVFRVRGSVSGAAAGGRGQIMVMLSPTEGGIRGPQNMSPARPPDYRFEIRGVVPGSYVLHTEPRGPNQQMVAYQAIEVMGNHVDGVALSVVAGNDISGSVKVEDSTKPVELPNLTVNLQPTLPVGAMPRAKTGEGMKFTLKNVAPMHYRVYVNGVPEGCFVKSIRYGGTEVPEDGIDMVAAAPLEITLSATAGEISAAVIDKDGKPVPNALVALLPNEGKSTRANTTDEAGAVTFRTLKPGDYRLMAFEDIPSGAYQDPEFIKPFEGSAASVKLDPSGRQAIQIKVIPAADTDK